MKNIFKSSLLLIGALAMFTACSDDNGSNPTLVEPNSFVLNTPAYADAGIDLKGSETVNFSWSQPDYGYPAAVNYSMQVSLDGNFTVSTEEADADESGATVADYANVEIQDEDRDLKGSANAEDFATALEKIAKWTEDNVPETQEVYCRMVATTTGANPVYSNVVKINVVPCYVELKDAAPIIWYMVGGCIGSGSWSNDKVGGGLVPLLPNPEVDIDKKTGTGELIYVGWFPKGGQFKFVRDPGSWDAQLNYTNVDNADDGVVTDEDGDNHNLGIPEDGLYKIVVNTATNKVTVTKYDGTEKVHSTITMPGTYNGWDVGAGNPLTALNGLDNNKEHNHDWFGTVTFDNDANVDGDQGVKFANGSWDVNWGGDTFPLGVGSQGGKNIRYKAGTYTVFFNDILGIYYFIAQ